MSNVPLQTNRSKNQLAKSFGEKWTPKRRRNRRKRKRKNRKRKKRKKKSVKSHFRSLESKHRFQLVV